MNRKWKQELGLAAAVVIVAFLALGFLLEPGKMPYSDHSDLLAEHLPLKNVAYQSLRAGNGLPYWTHDILSGRPALTNPQAVYTHPLHVLYALVSPGAATGPTLWLHFAAMGISLLVLGGVLGLSWPARLFMGLVGLFSFKLIAIGYAGWLPVWSGFVLAPLALAALLRMIERPGLGPLVGFGCVWGLALISGHLQIPYYLALFGGAYVAWEAIRRLRSEGARASFSLLGGCAAGSAIALLVSAHLLLPLASEAHLTARTTADFDFMESGARFGVADLATFLHPEIHGTPLDGSYADVELWEKVAYFGAIPELLAIAGLFWGRRRRHVAFLGIGLVLSIAASFDSLLLRAVYEIVPGFSLFRHPGRFLFLATLFGIALSGFGFEGLMERLRGAGAGRRNLAFATAVAVVLTLTTIGEGRGFARRYLTMRPIPQVLPDTDYARWLRKDPEPFRVAPFGRDTVNAGWAHFLGLEIVTGFEPYNYTHYQRYMELLTSNRVVDPQPVVWTRLPRIARFDLLDTLGVKYVIAPRPLERLPHDFQFVQTFEQQPVYAFYEGLGTADLVLYRNPHARPRAFWAQRLQRVSGPVEAAQALRGADATRITIVESETPLAQAAAPAQSDSIQLTHRRPGLLEFDVERAEDGFAVVSEVWHPGWRAELDGTRVAIHRSQVALLGVAVPQGRHQLVLRFEPLHVGLGWALTATGLVAILALSVLWLRGARGRVDQGA